MDYYIGIDSGGTKTEFVLANENGHILQRDIGCGCNPLDVGVEFTRTYIIDAIQKLVAATPGRVVSIYGGIAGVNHVVLNMETILHRDFPGTEVRFEDDRRMVVSGTLGHQNGCGMICGTGSSLSIIIDDEPIRQVGGLGYLIDTGGSGFELGQAGLKAAFRYLDGRSEYTVLTDLITKAVGKDPWTGMGDIYAGGRPFIASLAYTVFEALELGDKIAANIVDSSAYKLSELTYAAEKYFDGVFPVVMTGGIFQRFPRYAELVREKASKMADMITANVPPIYGALVEAMWQNGKIASDNIREAFLLDYSKLSSVEKKCCG